VKRKINVVFWTWQQYKVVKTQKVAKQKLMAWKKWYQRQGWMVHGNNNHGYIAWQFDANWLEDRPNAKIHSVGYRALDEQQFRALEDEQWIDTLA